MKKYLCIYWIVLIMGSNLFGQTVIDFNAAGALTGGFSSLNGAITQNSGTGGLSSSASLTTGVGTNIQYVYNGATTDFSSTSTSKVGMYFHLSLTSYSSIQNTDNLVNVLFYSNTTAPSLAIGTNNGTTAESANNYLRLSLNVVNGASGDNNFCLKFSNNANTSSVTNLSTINTSTTFTSLVDGNWYYLELQATPTGALSQFSILGTLYNSGNDGVLGSAVTNASISTTSTNAQLAGDSQVYFGFGTQRASTGGVDLLDNFTVMPAAVPEPSTDALIGLGFVAAGVFFFQKRKKAHVSLNC